MTENWGRDTVLEALRHAGWSLRQLALHHGISPSTLAKALWMPYPRGEQRIAEAIGRPAHEIWPSRYDADGVPNRKMGRPKNVPRVIPILRPKRPRTGIEDTTAPDAHNVQVRGVA